MTRHYNIKLQIILLFILGIMTFFLDKPKSLLLIIGCIVFLCFEGLYKKAIHWLFIACVLYLTNLVITNNPQISALSFLGIFIFIIIKMLPSLIIASSISEVSTGKLLAALQEMKLPRNVVTTITILFRFFPVLMSENKTIQDAAVLRGISYKHVHNWKAPLKIFEYSIIPLLMRTLSLGEELSKNGFIRGMDSNAKRISIYSDNLTKFDYTCIPIMIFFVYLLFLS